MSNASLQYEIIEECKCGFEEFFILLGLIDTDNPEERRRIAICLQELIMEEMLVCEFKGNIQKAVTASELVSQIELRLSHGEDLNSYPECCEEYYFMTTVKGLARLSDEDKPTIGG